MLLPKKCQRLDLVLFLLSKVSKLRLFDETLEVSRLIVMAGLNARSIDSKGLEINVGEKKFASTGPPYPANAAIIHSNNGEKDNHREIVENKGKRYVRKRFFDHNDLKAIQRLTGVDLDFLTGFLRLPHICPSYGHCPEAPKTRKRSKLPQKESPKTEEISEIAERIPHSLLASIIERASGGKDQHPQGRKRFFVA